MHLPRGRWRRLAFLSSYALYLTLLGWLGIRLFWAWQFGVPFTESPGLDQVWDTFYPEVRDSGLLDLTARDETVDAQARRERRVLLLGASVLEQVAPWLEQELPHAVDSPVRLFNLCRAGHTSRDSYLKYTKIADAEFDLIVYYDCINDARMNCCPTIDFREDYTHCAWYATIESQLTAGGPTFSGAVRQAVGRKIPLDAPAEADLDFGRVLKTPPAFRRNLREILEGTRRAGQAVVLATFAWYVPEGYTRQRCERGQLDYGPGAYHLALELWGRPEAVAATITAHNGVIRELAAEFEHVELVEMEASIPLRGEYFSDVCHLTEAGCRLFAAELASAIARRLGAARAP